MSLRNKIDKGIEYILIALMIALVADVLWQVAGRYLFTTPSSFTDELAGFLLIWVGLLGAAYVAGKHEHLAIDLLLQKANAKNKRRYSLVVQACILLFSVSVMVIGGTYLVITRFQLMVTSAALEINLGYVYSVLPLSGLFITYYSIDSMISLWQSKPSES